MKNLRIAIRSLIIATVIVFAFYFFIVKTVEISNEVKTQTMIEFPATVIKIEIHDLELDTYTIKGRCGIEIEFLDQCGRHKVGDTVRIETVSQ